MNVSVDWDSNFDLSYCKESSSFHDIHLAAVVKYTSSIDYLKISVNLKIEFCFRINVILPLNYYYMHYSQGNQPITCMDNLVNILLLLTK
jgi:hypothetical protein